MSWLLGAPRRASHPANDVVDSELLKQPTAYANLRASAYLGLIISGLARFSNFLHAGGKFCPSGASPLPLIDSFFWGGFFPPPPHQLRRENFPHREGALPTSLLTAKPAMTPRSSRLLSQPSPQSNLKFAASPDTDNPGAKSPDSDVR